MKTKTPLEELQAEHDRLKLELADYKARWRKVSAILGLNEAMGKIAVLAKLRLIMARIDIEPAVDPKLEEAKKRFLAVDALHAKIDEAMMADMSNENIVTQRKRLVSEKRSIIRRFFARQ